MNTPYEPPREPEQPQPAQPPAGWTPPIQPTPLPPGPPDAYFTPYEPPKRRSPALLVMAAVVAVLLAVGGGVGIGYTLARVLVTPQASAGAGTEPGQANEQAGGGNGNSSTSSTLPSSTLSKVEAAVVDINTSVQGVSGTGQAAGTGMILTSGGEVLTNNHVVDGATSIRVTIEGHSGDYSAKVLGVDPTADVALIQVEGVSGLPTVKIAPASSVHIGEAVVALGNALGQGGAPSVTEGTITALNQSITASEDNGASENLRGLIEADASISPGDSGGALVDSSGRVVGMITAGQTGGFRNTTSTAGYAVPASTAMDVVKQIRAGKASAEILIGQAGYIGVQVRNLDADTATQLGLGSISGVLVVGVESGSPAERAGLAANDVITAINGTATPNMDALGAAIHSHHPGQTVSVTWTDSSGHSHTAPLTLVSGPAV